MNHVDGPEQRTAYYDELAHRGALPERDPPARATYLIENVGYPVTTWLSIIAAADEVECTIIQIDLYADEARTQLLVDDVALSRFSKETQVDIEHALHGKICSARDSAAFMRRVDEMQAALR